MLVPCIAARFAGLRDGLESPCFSSRLRIECDDVVPACDAPTGADHDLAFGYQRPTGKLEAFVDSERLVPRNLPGLHIERDHMDIRSAEVDPAAVDCDVAFYARIQAL